ncbi:MAG: DUF4249 domain-containing protein [Bacteroidetes bacterium]|nr:DUF4249 domain-containing protein [Bacteroidota bacterium]
MPQHGYTYRTCLLVVLALLLFARCRKPFEPVVFTKGDHYLVVDGIINTAPGGVTSFTLTRTANLNDTVINTPEHGAIVRIEGAAGGSYALGEQGSTGIYNSAALSLNTADKFRISIQTASGGRYQSDYATPHPSPAIDSITWNQDADGVTIYANTHDPANKTIYYRWEYLETWQYESRVYSEWGVANNLIYHRDSLTQQWHVCWKTVHSTDIILGTSVALSQDVISIQPLVKIPVNDGRLDIRYSTLVSQYALTPEAYAYWQIIEKNTKELGGLFDEQPSQLVGNIHSLSNPNEPVIGFVTAGTVQKQRIFIDNHDLQGQWKSTPPDYGCELRFTFQNPNNFAIFDYPDKSWGPVYFQSGGGLAIARNICMDCTMEGGVNIKPSYW